MRILVTGGAGFIGTNFVYRMTEQGHFVRVIDKLTYAGGRDNLVPLGNKVQLVRGDICSPAAVTIALEEIDTVVHFAAESHVTRSETDPGVFMQTNVLGTEVMLHEACRLGISRFVHISTDEVYGSLSDGYFKESDKLLGDSQASSVYAKSKSLADDLALALTEVFDVMEIVVVRMTNNFGPWQFPEKALPRWITNLLLGEKIPLWGEGLQVRDWLYAPVCCEGIEHILRYGLPGQAYNIAANNQPEITNRHAAEMVCGFMGKNPDEWIRHDPDPRPDHDFRYALDCSKIHTLGWKPPQEIEQQFEVTVKWYHDHRDWWEPRKAEAERIYT
jgi:dTDP-glucose 4,6-dehydratase